MTVEVNTGWQIAGDDGKSVILDRSLAQSAREPCIAFGVLGELGGAFGALLGAGSLPGIVDVVSRRRS